MAIGIEFIVAVLALAIAAFVARRWHARRALNRADAAIRELAAYRTALDTYAIVAVTDAKGNITFANDRFCEISGYARHELIGQNHRILNSRHHPKSFFVSMWLSIGQGKSWHGEICNRAKDGHTYWVDTTIIPLIGQDGRPNKYVAVRHDITERKQFEASGKFGAEVTARVSDIQSAFIEHSWQEAFDIALRAFNALTQSEHGIIGEVDRKEGTAPSFRTLAITPGSCFKDVGSDLSRRRSLSEADALNIDAVFADALIMREPVIANDLAPPHLPGQPLVRSIIAVPVVVYGEFVAVVGAANRPGGYSSKLVDALRPLFEVLGQLMVSKRNKEALWESQVALAESEQKFRSLTDIAADWCWQTDAKFKFTNATVGFSVQTGLGDNWLSAHSLTDLPALKTKYSSSESADAQIAQRTDFRDHCVIVPTASGVPRYVRLHARAQHNDKGEFTGYLGTASDITDVTEHAQMIQQADRLQSLGTMAAGLAHEFNNVLGIVAGHSELSKMALQRGESDPGLLEPIAEAARRGARLTKSLLSFGRSQSSATTQAIDVSPFLLELKLFLKPLIGPAYKIEMKAHGDDLSIRANKDMMVQAIVNLVLNARDAMTQGGQIRIRARPVLLHGHTDGVEISVTDRGPGIAPQVIKRIFDPFFTTKEVGRGTGLGLPLVFRFAKESGGDVRVRSKLGMGSRFSITLPRAHANDRVLNQADRSEDSESLFHGRSAILVDDEPALVTAYGAMLRHLGLEVREFTNPYEALAAIDDGAFSVDVLISDVLMPDLDGPSLVNLAKSLKPELRAILVTGQPERMGRDKTQGLENVEILPKPFEMADLRAALVTTFSRATAAAA